MKKTTTAALVAAFAASTLLAAAPANAAPAVTPTAVVQVKSWDLQKTTPRYIICGSWAKFFCAPGNRR